MTESRFVGKTFDYFWVVKECYTEKHHTYYVLENFANHYRITIGYGVMRRLELGLTQVSKVIRQRIRKGEISKSE